MRIVAKVGTAMQHLFGGIAEQAARSSGVIVRQRKFTAVSLARTFVLGFLQDAQASDEVLAQIAVQAGADVTPQAIDQRHTPQLAAYLKALFVEATRLAVGSDKAMAPLLERFTNVTVLDSSTISLPDSMQEEYRGCGGGRGGGAAAMKLQTEWDLRSGAVTHVEIEPGRSPDGASCRQQARRGRGSLRITDLGYFDLAVFADMDRQGEYFLSRLHPGTAVFPDAENAVDLLAWLPRQPGPFVDQVVHVGKGQQLRCRLIAWRLPKERADQRRQKLRRHYRDKFGKEPSAERLAWCDWTILVTNVPLEKMTPAEAAVLYRCRWQVELLFKRWKSQDLVAVLHGSTDVRQMVRVWSRLLAALVQHWLVVATVWGDPTKSLSKVCEAIRPFVGRLIAGLDQRDNFERVLEDIGVVVAKTCRRNHRASPGTFELLNDVSLLDFCLT
jgi:hypothetical protein